MQLLPVAKYHGLTPQKYSQNAPGDRRGCRKRCPPPAPAPAASSSSCSTTLPSHGSSAAERQHLRGHTGNPGLKSCGYTPCSSSIAGGCTPFYTGAECRRDPATRIPHPLPRLKVGWVGLIPAPQPLITDTGGRGGMKPKAEPRYECLAWCNTLLPR